MPCQSSASEDRWHRSAQEMGSVDGKKAGWGGEDPRKLGVNLSDLFIHSFTQYSRACSVCGRHSF